MHPHSTEASSECMCCLHTQQARGWEERSLWQQMWNYISELTSKIFDSREMNPQCFSNQCGKHLNQPPSSLSRVSLCPQGQQCQQDSWELLPAAPELQVHQTTQNHQLASAVMQLPCSRRGGAGLVASQDPCQGLSCTVLAPPKHLV